MRTLSIAATLVLVLTGATCQHRGEAPVVDPDPQCYEPCTPSLQDTGVRWEADPEDPAAWDDLAGRAAPELGAKLLQCERRRQHCAGFITDLKTRGVIRAKE